MTLRPVGGVVSYVRALSLRGSLGRVSGRADPPAAMSSRPGAAPTLAEGCVARQSREKLRGDHRELILRDRMTLAAARQA